MQLDQLKRRTFITLLGGAAAGPLVSHAQQPERVRRTGFIMQIAEQDPQAHLTCWHFKRGCSSAA
jgi:putative ABC transport system substrate-binding protein